MGAVFRGNLFVAGIELFILEGEQAGAHAPLQPGSSIDISSDLDSDIVLRDPLVAGQQIRLSVGAESSKLDVLAGDVELMGQRVGAGESVELSPCVPLKIGGTTLAYGEVNDPRWVDALQFGADTSNDDLKNETAQPHTHAESSSATRPQKPLSPDAARSGLTVWLAVGCLGLFGLFTGVYALNSTVVSTDSRQASKVSAITLALQNTEFSSLRIEEPTTDKFAIYGYLETQEQRAQLEHLLAELGISVQIQVQVGEQLVRAVRDVYRLNGIAADVQPQGPGIVQVLTMEANTEQLKRVETIARRDVAGLRDIVVGNTEPDAQPSAAPIKNNPGKRIASVVPGNPAYLVTTDGARYFVGAMLPTGHKIAAISTQQVLLDRDGVMTMLNF